MKILGMGLPELLMVLLVVGVPILIVVLVLRRSNRKKQQAPEALCQQVDSPKVLDSSQAQAPLLDGWKTSVGFSVLGAVVGFPLAMLLAILLALPVAFGVASGIGSSVGMPGEVTSAFATALVTPVAAIFFYVLTIVYATVFYPSYFGSKPKLRSSRAISFLNLTFGFVVFGALWNGGLTKKAKGASHIVLVVLTALMLAGMTVNAGSVIVQGLSYSDTDTNPSIGEASGEPSEGVAGATVSAGNIAFTYPGDWVLTTEADFEDLEGLQILGANPTAFSSVGPQENENIVFTAYHVPDFAYSYESTREQMAASEQFEAETVMIDGREAIMLTQPSGDYLDLAIIPNIEGKVTTIFSAHYPSQDAVCAAVVDSLAVI